MAAIPLLLGGAVAAFALWQKRKDEAERARTATPPAVPPQAIMPGAEVFLPYFVQYQASVPASVINAAANVLYARNPTAAHTLANNLDATGYGPIAAIIRNAFASKQFAYPQGAAAGRARVRRSLDALTAGWDVGDEWDEAGIASISGAARRRRAAHNLIRQC